MFSRAAPGSWSPPPSTRPTASLAANLGARVHTLNPGSGSYHPKVYLARHQRRVHAVVGSANLTGGLATNVEVAVVMRGTDDRPLATLHDWAATIYQRSEHWLPTAGEAIGDDELAPDLLDALSREWPGTPCS